MKSAVYVAVVVTAILNLWLLKTLFLWNVRKRLPWFVGYIAWGLAASCVSLIIWPINRRLYGSVCWWLEPVNIILVVGALRESLLKIFENSSLRSRLQRLLWFVITGVLAYSAWKAIVHPPVQSDLLKSSIIGIEFTLRWGIAAVAIAMAFYLPKLKKDFTQQEPAVIAGLGLSALTVLIWVISRSASGTGGTFFTKFVPSMGYWLAVVWWGLVFRPQFGLRDLGITVEEALNKVGIYRKLQERMLKAR
jgi:hypothetical protein